MPPSFRSPEEYGAAIALSIAAANATCSMNAEAFYNHDMKISARNQLRGTVESVSLGVVTARVGVRVGENLIESVITRQSVEEMNIKVGQQVTAVIKSTEVMLMVE